MTLGDVEKQHIQWVLEHAEGRINGKGGAAELLAIHPKHYDIECESSASLLAATLRSQKAGEDVILDIHSS